MTDLDDKLREIVGDEAYETRFGTNEISDKGIAQIKQAFADEEAHLKEVKTAIVHQVYLTGQEWYDRFEKELKLLAEGFVDDKDGEFFYKNKQKTSIVLVAAKRAAGIK